MRSSRDIEADNALIFELIADPSQQPRWDGNDNLSLARPGQRVHAVGDVFAMTLTTGSVRESHVVEFVRVTHTYDWTQLTDESRIARAEWTTADRLAASLDRLAALAHRSVVEDRSEPR